MQMAINQFTDLTTEEFASTRLGAHPSKGGLLRERVSGESALGTAIATSRLLPSLLNAATGSVASGSCRSAV